SHLEAKNSEVLDLKSHLEAKNSEALDLKATLHQRENSLSWRFSQYYGKYFSMESSATKTISSILNNMMNNRESKFDSNSITFDENHQFKNETKSKKPIQIKENLEINEIYFGEEKGKVSVVLPVYNQANLLEESIQSVLNQTYQNFELIVVNDGSSDNVESVLDKYADHPNILIVTQKNQKLPRALTNGFRYATGEFHTWTSADNIMLPKQLEEQVKFLQENPAVDMVYCNYEAIDDRGNPLVNSNFRVHNQKATGSNFIHLPRSTEKLNVVNDNFIGACFMYRCIVSKVIGEYDPNSFGCEDYDYWMRVNNLFTIKHLGKDDALYRYRVHDNTLSAKAEEFDIFNKVEKLIEYEAERKEFYEDNFDIFFLNESSSFDIVKKNHESFHNIVQINDLNEIKNYGSFKKCILFSNNIEMNNVFKKFKQNEEIFKIIVAENEINENKVDNEAFALSDWIITLNERTFNLLYNIYPEKIMLVPFFKNNVLDVILKLANNKIFYRLTRPDEKSIPPQIYFNRKLNVLIETKSLDKGGLEQVIFDLATNIDKNSYEIFIACIDKAGHIAEKCRKNGIPVFLINNDEKRYEEIIKEHNIDLINSHYSNFGVNVASKLSIPIISVIHNNYVWLDSTELSEFREVDNCINKYIAVSKNVSRYSRHHFEIDAKKIEIIPNGLNIERYNKLSKDTLKTRTDFGVNNDDYIFLHVAACQGAKGHNLLISAMKDLVVKYPKIKIISVGHTLDFNYCNTIKERIKDEKLEENIIFKGFVSEHDLINIYQISDAFLLPSLFEGWSISMMEAMYFGLPLILTDVGASRDIIKDNDIGMIIPNSYGDIVNLNCSNLTRYYSEQYPTNTDHLKSVMIDFYERKEEWKMNGKRGIEKLKSYYTIDKTMKKYEDIFTAVYKKIPISIKSTVHAGNYDIERDYSSEMGFWENHLAKNDEYVDYLEMILNKDHRKEVFPKKLLGLIKDLSDELNHENIKLLEVGSGPTSNLAWGVDNGLFEITAIDPLANFYNNLIDKHNYSFPIRSIEGAGEDILDLFNENTFHMVYSQNALDHAVSPKECLINMYSVLKNGGMLYLCGNVKEGTNEGWKGLHQHDLIPIDNQLFHFDKEGKPTDLTGNLGLELISCNKSGDSPGDWYNIAFRKNE
ncbi:MAG: glycosyltransferase, partial [Methanococcoides sp.]|nr:glycosyltransferase [Methanococcoides sp.]